MFDLGFSELVLIFAVGLIVLGPEKLPRVARFITGSINKLKSFSQEIQQQLMEESPTQDIDQLNHSLKTDLNSLRDDLKHNLLPLEREINAFGEPITPSEKNTPLPLPSFKAPLNQRHRQRKRQNMRKKTTYRNNPLRKHRY